MSDGEKNSKGKSAKLFFKNSSQLGAFGEFAYKKVCARYGVSFQKTNFCHTDFRVDVNKLEKYVDVKTTLRHKNTYKGKRFNAAIIYDLISISENKVLLVPDKASPFESQGVIEVGDLAELHKDWMVDSSKKEERTSIISNEIINALKNLFAASKYRKTRIVARGDASRNRWTGTVDNLPGSESIVSKNDATVFLQYGCCNFTQTLASITLFPHELITSNQVPMLEPNLRQKNKGIQQVIDLDLYRLKFPSMFFQDFEKFILYAKNNFR